MSWLAAIGARLKAPELMRRMFERAGVYDAMLSRPNAAAVVRNASVRCMACAHTEECAHWLENGATADMPAPDYCRNADLIARLGRLDRPSA